MSERILTFWLLILFLFPHGLFSKSATKSEYTIEGGSLIAKSDADQSAIEDSPGLHDSYRPRHKYKTDSGSLVRFSRSEIDGEKELEVKIPQCAVMYKNSEPVGILQPYEDSYRFLQVSGEPTLVDINPIPVKRKTIMDVLYPSKVVDEYDDQSLENTAQFTDERYPSIFAKFKIDSRLDKSLNPDVHLKRSMHKRGSEKASLNEIAPAGLKSSLVKKSDEGIAVEDELKNILDDMGLIDDYSDNKEEAKREAEDENLELGTNKIVLVKEESKEKRDKREDQNSASTIATTSTTSFLSKKSISPNNPAIAPRGALLEEAHNQEEKENHVEEERSVDMLHSIENSKVHEAVESVDSDISTEKEADEEELRKKRHNDKDSKDSKRSAFSSMFEFTTSSLVKEAELTEYERRVEREIRDKIEKLKSEVKKEISELKQTDSKNKKESFAEDTKRKKRQAVNTLLDEESVDINPLVSGDEKNMIHIRRKRETDSDKPSTVFDHSLKGESEDTFELKNQQNEILKDAFLIKEERFREKRDTDDSDQQPTILDDLLKSEEHLQKRQDQTVEDATLVTEKQVMADEKKSFIGINPILENDTGSSYHIRTLKQHSEDESLKESGGKIHVSLKREYSKSNEAGEEDKYGGVEMNTRKKRDADEGLEEDAYQDDESEFNEDVSYDSLKSSNTQSVNENLDADPAQIGNIENSPFGGGAYGCKCDKSGNGCKCGSPKIDLNIPNFKQEDSNAADSINLLEKKSIGQHCNCGKNDNHCKCGHILDDIPPSSPFKRDYLSNQQSVGKVSGEEKDSGDDLQVDPQANFPRRIKERRNANTLPLDEAKNSLNEELNENFASDKSSFMKRDTKARKYSGSRPFKNGEYFVDLHPDIYRLSPGDNSREKRDNFELVAMHGDSPIRKHMVAIKERSVIPHSRIRRRVLADDDKQPRQLIDMSEEDLFGALPQSYAGELARYKRVKRTKTKK